MKKRLNKKGFTLIEMLVVIAIIAVLVAIIIPVVSGATDKAAYATNAANLRSYKAEITTSYLLGEKNDDTNKVVIAADGTVTVTGYTAPALKDAKNFEASSYAVTVKYENGDFVVKAGDYTIESFAAAAESGTLTAPSAGDSGSGS